MMEDGRVVGLSRVIFAGVLALGSAITVLTNSGAAYSSVILTFDGSQLSGARNVLVLGDLYDVEFKDDSCFRLFDDCNNNEDFAFNTKGAASAAGNALFEFVFKDGPMGNFNSDPGRTLGCGNPVCKTLIPYTISIRSGYVNGVLAENWDERASPTDTVGIFQENILGDTSEGGLSTKNYAVFTLHTVPIPAALPLFATGLGVLGFVGWRRHKVKGGVQD
jgi:hypothetical protein